MYPRLFASLILIGILTSCGAEAPFHRGASGTDPFVNPNACPGGGNPATALTEDYYNSNLNSIISRDCASCHSWTYSTAKAQATAGDLSSKFYTKPAGTGHAGGTKWAAGSTELDAVKSWICGS
ncbi:MAG: hypothetical protein HY537_14650 [Deltaproteobacteria bacterium]|nr:hypothetical protein [Deltaproteobacteria bacterium]